MTEGDALGAYYFKDFLVFAHWSSSNWVQTERSHVPRFGAPGGDWTLT